MKATVEVKDRKEAQLIRAGLTDPVARATVKMVGALLPLSGRARLRVLAFMQDKLAEEAEN